MTARPTTSASAVSTTCSIVGRNVNILVLDTEVYSNTGGQASKATSRRRRQVRRLGQGQRQEGPRRHRPGLRQRLRRRDRHRRQRPAGDQGNARSRRLARAVLVIAYSTCIAHGIDMATSMSHQKDAVRSGYWPLYRFQPSEAEHASVQARLQAAVEYRSPSSSPARPASPCWLVLTPSGRAPAPPRPGRRR